MVKCGLCGLEFDRITAPHLKHKHGLNSIIEYWEKCPGAPTCSEESSRRTSEANSGYEPTPETIRKLRESHMGIEQSGETKELHRKSSLAMWAGRSKEEKQDILGRGFRSEEAQIKVANSVRRRYENMTDEERYASTAPLRDPGMVRRRAISLQKYWDGKTYEERQEHYRNSFGSEEALANQREVTGTPGYRAKVGKLSKLAWASMTPERKAEVIRNNPWFHSVESSQSPNGPERMLQKFLDQSFPGVFIPDWIDRIDIGGRHPDFRTKNRYKLVVESNGTFWHSPEYFDRPTEKEQIAHYKKYGYDCIVVWANSAEDIICEWPALAREIMRRI